MLIPNQRRARVHAFQDRRTPGKVEILFPRDGIKRQQAATQEDETPVAIGPLDDQGRCVTGQIIRQLDNARLPVRLSHATTPVPLPLNSIKTTWRDLLIPRRTAADHGDQQVSIDDRRAAHAKEILHNTILLAACQPSITTIRRPPSEQCNIAFDTKHVNAIVVDNRRRSRARTVVVQIDVIRCVRELPNQFPGLAVQAQQDRLALPIIKLKVPTPTHTADAVAFTRAEVTSRSGVPQPTNSARRPVSVDLLSPRGPEKRRPIFALRPLLSKSPAA